MGGASGSEGDPDALVGRRGEHEGEHEGEYEGEYDGEYDGEYEDATAALRREEELAVGTSVREAGRVGVRKVVDHERASRVVPVGTEHADLERHAAGETDSGEVEVLPDGAISIPVFQEELVIEKRLVVRERVVIRKHIVTEDQLVEADLRRERVEVDADPDVADRVG